MACVLDDARAWLTMDGARVMSCSEKLESRQKKQHEVKHERPAHDPTTRTLPPDPHPLRSPLRPPHTEDGDSLNTQNTRCTLNDTCWERWDITE